jgi:hypothetical protein
MVLLAFHLILIGVIPMPNRGISLVGRERRCFSRLVGATGAVGAREPVGALGATGAVGAIAPTHKDNCFANAVSAIEGIRLNEYLNNISLVSEKAVGGSLLFGGGGLR